ncbi:MAG: hypothetical protein AAF633_10630, partial [Chloroflexota bacterium]
GANLGGGLIPLALLWGGDRPARIVAVGNLLARGAVTFAALALLLAGLLEPLLIGLAAGAVLPRYFFFFSSAPLLFSESGYERYERGELTQKEKEARQNGCMIGIVTGLYSLACGVVILGCMSWLLSDDGPPTLIFRITLIIQLLYAGIVPFLAIHFEPEFSPT